MDIEKEKRAIEYLKAFEPAEKPYYICYSGGKDSDCIRILAQLADVNHIVRHNCTTVDAPETMRYVIKTIGRENIKMPPLTMDQLIIKKGMPPTRLVRYCCNYFKERGGKGYLAVTGVRWAESKNRKDNQGIVTITSRPETTKKGLAENNVNFQQTNRGGVVLNDDNSETRRFVEHCYRTATTILNPIVDWTDDDVWQFLKHYGCESNPLYQEGFRRIGCVGCPLGGPKNMKREFARWPSFRKRYVRTFDKMLKKRLEDGKVNGPLWQTGEGVMRWWLGDNPDQITLEDYYGELT